VIPIVAPFFNVKKMDRDLKKKIRTAHIEHLEYLQHLRMSYKKELNRQKEIWLKQKQLIIYKYENDKI